jgi:hypothetical protein
MEHELPVEKLRKNCDPDSVGSRADGFRPATGLFQIFQVFVGQLQVVFQAAPGLEL